MARRRQIFTGLARLGTMRVTDICRQFGIRLDSLVAVGLISLVFEKGASHQKKAGHLPGFLCL